MTERIPLDDLNSDQLDALYDRLKFTDDALARMRDRAEVTVVRVRRVLSFAEQVIATTGIGPASAVQAVLDRLHTALADRDDTATAADGSACSCGGRFPIHHLHADEHRPVDEPAAWTPPPPGDRREQLPDHILALLDIPPYTSTACETAELLAAAITRHPEHADELRQWEQRQRQRCRINNKYTGVNCRHAEPDDTDPDDLTGAWTPDPPIGCLTVTAEPTPSQRPELRNDIARAIHRYDHEHCLSRNDIPSKHHRGEADAVLTLLYREWPWLRAVAEDATPPPAT